MNRPRLSASLPGRHVRAEDARSRTRGRRPLLRGLAGGAALVALATGAGTASAFAQGDGGTGSHTSGSHTSGSQTSLARAAAPTRWSSTVLGSATPDANGDFYSIMGMFHDDHGMAMGTITADMVKRGEVAAGFTDSAGHQYTLKSCTGSTTPGRIDAVTCTFTSDSAAPMYAYGRATRTAYGHPGLILHYTHDKAAGRFKLPGGDLPVGSATARTKDPSTVTRAQAQKLAGQAILTQHDHEWDGSATPQARCQVRDHGAHLACDVTGTPAGGKGDGRWYGTAKTSSDGRVVYLFTRDGKH